MVSLPENIPVVNASMELSECRDRWTFDETCQCWCLEDVLYTSRADVPRFQRLSIFVPAPYLHADGTPDPEGELNGYTGKTAPVVFENNAAGYMQMPHTWLGGPRCYAEPYLKHGLIYVTCGCRGRDSRNAEGLAVGKSPITLIDLKTAIRFLRHNRAALPGDLNRILSVGWSAGGAMSSLLGVTGDNRLYDPYLKAAGAFMEESDAVYAAQSYCPIIDLEHADQAYEWCFRADATCENSPAGPAETMTPFKKALSAKLSERYVDYVNSLHLTDPETGAPLTLNPGGRSGSFYDCLMRCLSRSATEFLTRLEQGRLAKTYTVEDYLSGQYTYEAPAPGPAAANPGLHHAGPGIGIPGDPSSHRSPPSLGELMSRPPRGVPFVEQKPEMVQLPGTDKRSWLSWDGVHASVHDLDTYVLQHRRRMKPCTSFDKLPCDSGENHEFGTPETDYVHFNPVIGEVLRELKDEYPQEAASYEGAFDVAGDAALSERVFLINPLNFIGTVQKSTQAAYYRIRVGARDADTSLSVAMTLALKLADAGLPVDYALVWDQPHSEADYEGEILKWIDTICR